MAVTDVYMFLVGAVFASGVVQVLLLATDRAATERIAKRLPYDLFSSEAEVLDYQVAYSITAAMGFERSVRRFLDIISRITLLVGIGELFELKLLGSTAEIVCFHWTSGGFTFATTFVASRCVGDFDASEKRAALLRYGVAGVTPRIRAYLMSPSGRTWMWMGIGGCACLVVQLFTLDFAGVSASGVSSKDWYLPWISVRPFEEVETICLAEQAQKGTGRGGAVTSREQWAVAVRFRDGGYWTSIRSKRGEPEADVQRAAEYIAEKSGVAITKTETVWLDESSEANAKRAKKGIVRSPCAARESLVGVGAGVGGRVRVAAGMRVR